MSSDLRNSVGAPSLELGDHFARVAKAIQDGRVVPFLGAGVNLCGRPPGAVWQPIQDSYLPNGSELADYLADGFDYPVRLTGLHGCPDPTAHLDLARVSQFGVTMLDQGPLYDKLHSIFVPCAKPTPVHNFLAYLAAKEVGSKERPKLLIVTTNYDDLMEQALGDGNFDLVFYDADAKDRPVFLHKAPSEKEATKILEPNRYDYEFFTERPVVLKIHGTVDRTPPDPADPDRENSHESFVITEDQYISYLSENSLDKFLPPRLLEKMRKHHLWFLGYSLRDWNFRVFLRRLKRDRRKSYRSWAVVLGPSDFEKRFWAGDGVEVLDVDLESYIGNLSGRV